MKLPPAAAAVALGVVVFAGCGSDDAPAAGEAPATPVAAATVELEGMRFTPDRVTLEVGGTVTWEWKENVAHNVVADDFRSKTMREGTFEHTFDEAGTYAYRCTLHPGMDGVVSVVE